LAYSGATLVVCLNSLYLQMRQQRGLFIVMSVRILSEVFEKSETSGNARLVLIALADCASDDGACWPSIKRIAKMSKVSEQTAKKYLHAFEAIGLIEIEERFDRKGRRTSNIYNINIEQLGADKLSKKILYSVIPKSKKHDGVGVNPFTVW